jgi:hypothetical protein
MVVQPNFITIVESSRIGQAILANFRSVAGQLLPL